MSERPFCLERTVVIGARPATVFRFFTDSERWASWWGAGSTIEARPGGRLFIRHPNGVESAGEVLEVAPPERIVFTYGLPPHPPRILPRPDRPRAAPPRHRAHPRPRVRGGVCARRARAGLALPARRVRQRGGGRAPPGRRRQGRRLVSRVVGANGCARRGSP